MYQVLCFKQYADYYFFTYWIVCGSMVDTNFIIEFLNFSTQLGFYPEENFGKKR